jgi:hypothetical protein
MNKNKTSAMGRRTAAIAGLLLTVVLAPTAAMGLDARPGPLLPRHNVVAHSRYQGRSLGIDGSANAVEHRLLMARLSGSADSANAKEHALVSR